MPELPEVETVAAQLRSRILNKTISEVLVCAGRVLKTSPADFRKKLPGRKIENVTRRAKFIRVDLSDGLTLWLHLGMTGQLLWKASYNKEAQHVHFVLAFEGSPELLIYRDPRTFGGIRLTNRNPDRLPSSLRLLGPEPLEMGREDFVARFAGRAGRIKSLLLNQHLIAGLGNIYADESLFRAGIDPRKRPNRIGRGKLSKLYDAVRETLAEAIAHGGSTIGDYVQVNGESGKFQNHHQIYGREGQACNQCGKPVRKIFLAGRSSCFCSNCQT